MERSCNRSLLQQYWSYGKGWCNQNTLTSRLIISHIRTNGLGTGLDWCCNICYSSNMECGITKDIIQQKRVKKQCQVNMMLFLCLTPCSPWWPSRRVQIMQPPCLIWFEARKLCFSCQMLLPDEERINVKFSTWHMWNQYQNTNSHVTSQIESNPAA